jgi:hypothetical protein
VTFQLNEFVNIPSEADFDSANYKYNNGK